MPAWVSILGAVSGVLALLGLVYALGRYTTKIDAFWQMKEDLSAAIIKVNTLWKIYIEDSLIGHSNPGGGGVLPEELRAEIRTLLENDKHLGQVKEPTLLIIDRIGVARFSQIARDNKAGLGLVLAEVNSYVFACLSGHP